MVKQIHVLFIVLLGEKIRYFCVINSLADYRVDIGSEITGVYAQEMFDILNEINSSLIDWGIAIPNVLIRSGQERISREKVEINSKFLESQVRVAVLGLELLVTKTHTGFRSRKNSTPQGSMVGPVLVPILRSQDIKLSKLAGKMTFVDWINQKPNIEEFF
jgi:hypothetical protein